MSTLISQIGTYPANFAIQVNGTDTGTTNNIKFVPNITNPVITPVPGTTAIFVPANTTTGRTVNFSYNGGSSSALITMYTNDVCGGALDADVGAYAIVQYGYNNLGSLGWILLNSQTRGIYTSPGSSYAPSLSIGTNFHNTLTYDVVYTIYMKITAATSASILLGTGSASSPTQQTIVSLLTTAATMIIPIPIYLPSNYYALLSTSGTITQTITGQIGMPV